jgi:hypothetical protein
MENDLADYTKGPADIGRHSVKARFDLRGFLKSHSGIYLAFSYELQKIPLLRRFFERTGVARDIEGRVHKNLLDEKVLLSSRDEILKMVRSVDTAVVLIIPSRMLWQSTNSSVERRVHERFLALLQTAGISAVDMRPIFEKNGTPLEYYFTTDPHWNSRGHALAAQALAEYFRQP